ncbi:TIM barrel protein [Actinopolymorpha sp. NPDC004070]|uniref:TIM barrel protein n=1 Tax=Actinopolymorpha sp. NPDC004070 TaxID=3154548 RepID=UPI0033BDE4DC
MTFELSPNLTWLFTEAGPSPADRVRAAAKAGFRLVDTWSLPPADQAADYVVALRESGVTIMVVTAPIAEAGDAAQLQANLAALADALPLAQQIGARYFVVTGGNILAGVEPREQRAALVEFLTQAAETVAGSGVGILLENLNSRVDHRGCFLDSTPETVAIVREVGRPEVAVLYDAYHSLVMGEDVQTVLSGVVDQVKHVQVADVPGRHEPGTGTLDWPKLLADLEASGYTGPLGLEYQPTVESVASTELLRRVVAER